MARELPAGGGANEPGPPISKMDTTQKNRGWELEYDQGAIVVNLVNEWPKNAVTVTTVKLPGKKAKPLVPHGDWHHVLFTYDGSGKAAGVKIYIDGRPVATKVKTDALAGTIRTTAPLQLGWRYPEADPLRDTRYQDLRLYARTLTTDEVKRVPYEDYVAEITSRPSSQWTLDQWHTISDFYFNNIDQGSKAISSARSRKSIPGWISWAREATSPLSRRERPTIAYAHILTRGVYTARRDRVVADTPHFLPPLPPGAPHNRLGLAEWTVSPQNPLTARVTVNRMWNEALRRRSGRDDFEGDFGIMGQRPSHPELLDWLAVEFRESGWNVKHMYKLMVMSAAYRQSAKTTPDQMVKDPKNLLLAHGPRFRMDAEMVRDVALETSGLLVDKIGGPSVRTYQPPNVWESVGYPTSDTTKYKQDHGDALFRRSLYTFWKRMAIPPDMDAFDAPPRDAACTRRQRTNTPLQALVTMNDPQWIEASRALAERLIKEGGARPEQKITYLSELLLAHPPAPRMEAVLQNSYEELRRHYVADPQAAHDLVAIGEKPHDPAIPAPELAAWTMVANEAFNLDETLNK